MEWDSVCASALQTVKHCQNSLDTYLVALHAVLGKLGLMASHAVEVLPFREEASCPDDLLAVAAGEAVLVPDSALVLHVLISCGVGGSEGVATGSALQGAASARGATWALQSGWNAGPAVLGPHASIHLPTGSSPPCPPCSHAHPDSVRKGTPAVVI